MENLNLIITWWLIFFLIGSIFFPITSLIFKNFLDKGYIFSKILGITILSYLIFLLGTIHVLSFTKINLIIILVILFLINFFIFKKKYSEIKNSIKDDWKFFLTEEVLFFSSFFFWTYIKSFQPDIHGLEKFMDFGFINSILRADFFPPKDMWLTPFPINYYYFGHLITAVLIKLSGIASSIGYNFMLSTILALTFTSVFSIGLNLFKFTNTSKKSVILAAGLLTAVLVTFSGNLHTLYTLFSSYPNESPKPLWDLAFSPQTFPNSYWYPNATRFIYNTIHEFPIYSFVVSDLHGHVLDIPIVLLMIALLLSVLSSSKEHVQQVQSLKFKVQNYSSKFKILKNIPQLLTLNFKLLTLLAFLLAVMYMTNVLDFPIYFLLTLLVLSYLILKQKPPFSSPCLPAGKVIIHLSFLILIIGFLFFLFSLPFNINFKPFASGIGILCAPRFLTDIGNIGPFLFEKDHCQRSPWWQLLILYGFFYFWVISFIVWLSHKTKTVQGSKFKVQNYSSKFKILKNIPQLLTLNFKLLTLSDIFVLILITFSTFLIIIPEFIYFKDIYPAHYRANTMFKFVYQAFIILSIASGYIIIRIITNFKYQISNIKFVNWKLVVLVFIGSIGLFLVILYPYFAITSYFGNLKTQIGIDGISYLKNLYPSDYNAINWINKNIKGQPVIVEAQGDSYTDYARISSNTGLPTILGWTVHEWLWRGTYDVPAPRIEEVQTIYENDDIKQTKKILQKYNVSYVYIGGLEREKYPNLNEQKFSEIGKVIYQNEEVKIYKTSI